MYIFIDSVYIFIDFVYFQRDCAQVDRPSANCDEPDSEREPEEVLQGQEIQAIGPASQEDPSDPQKAHKTRSQ